MSSTSAVMEEKTASSGTIQQICPDTSPNESGIEKGQSDALFIDSFGNPLSPQPTTDPLDPLNWSNFRKYVIISIVCFGYFMMIYAITAPVPTFIDLQGQFGATYAQINWTFGIANLGASIGPLFFSAVGDIIGRRPIMILGTCVALVATGCSSVTNISIEGYSAARFFQAFGASTSITIGLSVIIDLSWEHQRGLRMGLWVMSLDIGAYFGPFLSSFIAAQNPAWVQYHVTILFAILFILEVFFLPETLYPRAAVHSLPNGQEIPFKRTTQLGYLNFTKIPGVHHPKPWHTMVQFFKMFLHPVIAISVITYSLSLYWWIMSVLTMIPVAYENYDLVSQGLMFLGLIIGTLVAEAGFSGQMSDRIIGRFTAKKGIARTPEMRLWLAYIGVVIFATGLVVWGFSVERNYHFMVGQVGFFLLSIGLQMTNTAIATYVVDNCPDAAMDIITFYSVWLNMSTFANSWFISDWVTGQGFSVAFGIQALISVVIMVPVLALLHRFGPFLRNLMNN